MTQAQRCETCKGRCGIRKEWGNGAYSVDTCPDCNGTGRTQEPSVDVRRYYWSDETGKVTTKVTKHGWHREVVLASDHDAALSSLRTELVAARAEIERLAGSLAACGVMAGCDDAESFNRWVLTPDNPHWTDSVAAVTRLQVEATQLRAEIATLRAENEKFRNMLVRYRHSLQSDSFYGIEIDVALGRGK